MTHIRERANFRDLLSLDALGISLFFIFLLMLIGFSVQVVAQENKTNEQNLYWALQGKTVKDERAMKTAAVVKQIYNYGFTINGVESWKQFEKIGVAYDRPNSLVFAFDHWDKTIAILENPETEIAVKIPSWPVAVLLIGSGSLIILALCLSIGYIVTNKDNDNWWKYPWKKWWAYLMIPALFPYIIIIQPAVAIYALIRMINGDHAFEKRMANLEKINQGEARKKSLEARLSHLMNNAEFLRQKWITLQDENAWKTEKEELKTAVEQSQRDLSRLGKDIEQKQIVLAQDKTRLVEIEKTKKEKSAKTTDDLSHEFDELLRLPGLKALEITNSEIKLYTDIDVRMRKRDAGSNFLVRIDRNGSIRIENLMEDSHGNKSFCFGDNAKAIQENIKRKNYLPAITYIMQAIQSH